MPLLVQIMAWRLFWTNVMILLIRTLGTKISEFVSEIHALSFQNLTFKNVGSKIHFILSWPRCVNFIMQTIALKLTLAPRNPHINRGSLNQLCPERGHWLPRKCLTKSPSNIFPIIWGICYWDTLKRVNLLLKNNRLISGYKAAFYMPQAQYIVELHV